MDNRKEVKEFKSLKTGDILLFIGKPKNPLMRLFDWTIQSASHSQYSHVAVVIRDPTFIHPTLKGLFVWESSWEGTPDPQDGKVKLGVQLTSFYQLLNNFEGQIYVRRLLKGSNCISNERLAKIHGVVYGKPYDIDIKDWKLYTEYMGGYSSQGAKHKVIKWFWKFVESCSSEEKARLVQFVTGCSRLPAQGFRALVSNDGKLRNFNIQSVSKKDSVYPRSHTCFNKLDLPMYESKSELETYMSCITSGDVFGFTIE